MNILFLTLVAIDTLEDRGIYQDLLRKFRDEGHRIYIATAAERRKKQRTHIISSDRVEILKVRTLNIKNTNKIEKGLGTILMERQYLRSIKRLWRDISFDLVLYSTPPITFSRVISYIKNRDNAFSYLLLKDIFPQNAVDMGMIKKNSTLYKFFRKKEISLYKISDAIGCMSPANVAYVNEHYNFLNARVEVSPNSIEPQKKDISTDIKNAIKLKYDLPLNKKVLVYGGNLGKPQGIDFLLETIDNCSLEHLFFVIVGDGTEYQKISNWFSVKSPVNARLLQRLSKADYDELISSCDLGLIFLSPKFTIPNFPSRLLPYLEMKIPVLAATDASTDIGKILEKNECGYWVKSGDTKKMSEILTKFNALTEIELTVLGENAFNLLAQEYTVEKSYNGIMSTYKELKN